MAANKGGGTANPQDHTSIVLEYLIKRGYNAAAQALKNEIDPTSNASSAAAPGSQGAAPTNPAAAATAPNAPQLERRNLGKAGLKREDPTPWRDGLLGLREFVFGSLDIHRPELLPILLPVYVHSFIDLVLLGFKDLAEVVFAHFVSDYASTRPGIVALLASLKTPHQIMQSETANLWRKERYIVRMTRRGWSLLLGWLQGGVQGMGLSGATGEIAERGREKMLGIINERVRVEIIDLKAMQENRAQMSEGGLESELAVDGDANAATPGTAVLPLKLGPMPADPKLEREVTRILQAEGHQPSLSKPANGASDVVLNDLDSTAEEGTHTELPLRPLAASDLPPYPPSFRTIDVKREVEKAREARKRIRLGPTAPEGKHSTLIPSRRGRVYVRLRH